MSIFLGNERDTKNRFYLPINAFMTHLGLMASTGKGKTTALEAIIHQLGRSEEKAAVFIIDRMGQFSFSLLLWFASRYCPQRIRDRVVYINPAREDLWSESESEARNWSNTVSSNWSASTGSSQNNG